MAGEGPVRIQLQPRAQVSGRIVTLADVACLSAEDRSLMERLKALPLGAAPMTGTRITLSREDLARRIRRQTGLSKRDLQWTGARTCLLLSQNQMVTAEALLRCAEGRLNQWGAKGSFRFRLDDRHLPREIRVPSGRLELKAQDPRLDVSAATARRQALWVEAWVDGRFVRALPVEFEVESPAPSLGVLTGADRGEPAPSIPEAATVKDGTPAPILTRGEQATLRVRQGLLVLESKVEVLEDGRVGQQIRVKRAGGSGWFQAWVVGPGELEVRP